QLTSPKKHISKTYAVTLDRPLNGTEAEKFSDGKLILEGEEKPCLPAELTIHDETHVSLVLHEGRYHQVRRMFAAVGNHVEALQRTHIGALSLDDTALAPGEYRALTGEELMTLVKPSSI
ncbi:MAG: 16S rRNA pseudouridine(516) synthase, partial [Mariprofundus sp.]|nr:16S rRNA pseudouridine(516) synthase [Mariprofundus sp.]